MIQTFLFVKLDEEVMC